MHTVYILGEEHLLKLRRATEHEEVIKKFLSQASVLAEQKCIAKCSIAAQLPREQRMRVEVGTLCIENVETHLIAKPINAIVYLIGLTFSY